MLINKNNQYIEALDAYGQAIQLTPNDANLYVVLRDVQWSRDEREAALESYEEAVPTGERSTGEASVLRAIGDG